MVHRQARANGGVIQPVTARFFECVMDLTVFISAARARQFVGADDVETVAGEIQILIGQLFAGSCLLYTSPSPRDTR